MSDLTDRLRDINKYMEPVAHEAADLIDKIEDEVTSLLPDHTPQWSSPEAKQAGKDPIGCVICFPQDGSWPCVVRMTVDDILKAINPEGEG